MGLRVGLTGGIGSGKSTVGHMLAKLGAHLVDTDAISRALTGAGGAALPAISAAFGSQMIGTDGAMNRDQMRALVFSNPNALQQLEAILHPLIRQTTIEQASQASPEQHIVLDIPLLVESHAKWAEQLDRILVIDTEVETQIQRVMSRNGWDRSMVERILAKQATRDQRREVADDLILNEGLSMQELQLAVQNVWRLWNNVTK